MKASPPDLALPSLPFDDHCFLSLKCLVIDDNVVDSNFHEKEKKKNYLLSDILVDSSLRNPVGKEYCSSCSVYMFLSRKKPRLSWGVGVFCLCCHPRSAIGAGGCIVMSGLCLGIPSHLLSQGLVTPVKRPPFPSCVQGIGSTTPTDTTFRGSGGTHIHEPTPGLPALGPPPPTVLCVGIEETGCP